MTPESDDLLVGVDPPAPSEVLDPAQLDQALLVLVIRGDGTAYSSVWSDVDRDALAGWVHDFADTLADHSCDACAAGVAHSHDSTG